MNKENKLVPEFRFPEFKNEEHWDSTPLDDLCELITKGTTPTTLGYSYTESGVNFIKIESILEGNINLEKAAFISTKCNEAFKRSQLKENDILFSIAGALGVVTTVSKEILPANTNQALSIIRLKNVNQKDYVKAYLKSNIISEEINKIKAGAAQLNISLGQIANFNILIPKNPKEQQKIASCLSSLDEVIAAHSQKLEVLKDHKKGLMQILFPSAGEKVPKYRFKEFENDGDWVEKKLGDIAELTSSKRVHLSDYVSSGVPFFRGKEISQLKTNQFPNDLLYISIEHYKEIKDKYGIPKKGDILITAVGTLGNVYCIKNDDEFYFKDGNLIWMKNISIDSHFLEVLLDVEKEKVLASAIGSSQKALTMAALNKIEFPIPKNPQEQQKIASCLSSLDTLITAQQEKIEQLKLHKKGLMQGLFPKIKE